MKFWSFKNLDEGVEMRLEGPISQDTWWGDEVTPALFKAELAEHEGKDLTIWINSPGGDVFAASVIYTAIKERKGCTRVKIDGMAASAASVIAMAGDTVFMSPTAIMMIHNPWTIAMGDVQELKSTISVLNEVKETIVNAYELKTSLSRDEISKLMDKETWMNAKKAVELGFADAVMYSEGGAEPAQAIAFSQRNYQAQICAKIQASQIDAHKDEPAVINHENILKYLNIEEVLANESKNHE
ncbi:Clp protease ClpP [bacterium]|nr:MAG: Clp protease ClpP [bacterium]